MTLDELRKLVEEHPKAVTHFPLGCTHAQTLIFSHLPALLDVAEAAKAWRDCYPIQEIDYGRKLKAALKRLEEGSDEH